MLQVNISGELENVLNELVVGDEKARVEFVKKTLAQALEDLHDYNVGKKAHEEWVAGGCQTYTYEEVMQKNGLL